MSVMKKAADRIVRNNPLLSDEEGKQQQRDIGEEIIQRHIRYQ